MVLRVPPRHPLRRALLLIGGLVLFGALTALAILYLFPSYELLQAVD